MVTIISSNFSIPINFYLPLPSPTLPWESNQDILYLFCNMCPHRFISLGPNTKVRTLKIFPNVIHDKTFVYPKDCFQCLFGLKRLKWLRHANLLWGWCLASAIWRARNGSDWILDALYFAMFFGVKQVVKSSSHKTTSFAGIEGVRNVHDRTFHQLWILGM